MTMPPLTIFLDTNVFIFGSDKADNPKIADFNKPPLSRLRQLFENKGLRLLMPEMFSMEMDRKIDKGARRIVEKFKNINSDFKDTPSYIPSQYHNSQLSSVNFSQISEKMHSEWNQFKNDFTLENLELVADLNKVIQQYINIELPFSNKKGKQKEFPDAFMANVIEHYQCTNGGNIAIISSDGDFRDYFRSKKYFKVYTTLKSYLEAFQLDELASDKLEQDVSDITIPTTTEDLEELKSVLNREQPTSAEIERTIELISTRGSNYNFFFRNVTSVNWLPPLIKNNFFKNPPLKKVTSEGTQVSFWEPIGYLERICDQIDEQAVIDIILKLGDVDNYRILSAIVGIVSKVNTPYIINKLKDYLHAYVIEAHHLGREFESLLNSEAFLHTETSETRYSLVSSILKFKDADKSYDPYIRDYDFREILTKHLQPTFNAEPMRYARLLIEEISKIIKYKNKDSDSNNKYDGSKFWCPHFEHYDEYQGNANIVAVTLSKLISHIHENDPSHIKDLHQVLDSYPWEFFERLSDYALANNLDQSIIDLVRSRILNIDFTEDIISSETYLLIKNSIVEFSNTLLKDVDLERILEEINQSPSEESCKEWMQDNFSDEYFADYKRREHFKTFRVFEPVLHGKYRDYYESLIKEFGNQTPKDYGVGHEVKTGFVSYESPQSFEELSNYTDNQLLDFINSWDSTEKTYDENFVEITIGALAKEFGNVVKSTIVPTSRITFWLDNVERIRRPVFVRALVSNLSKSIIDKTFNNYDSYLKILKWCTDKPNSKVDIGNEESSESPSWNTTRRRCLDSIDHLIENKSQILQVKHNDVYNIIYSLLVSPDDRLDSDRRIFLSGYDYLTEAINNTRSRALETLTKFTNFLKNQITIDVQYNDYLVQAISDRLEKQIISKAEYAMFGYLTSTLIDLDSKFFEVIHSKIYPSNEEFWFVTFETFLRTNRAWDLTFSILQDDYQKLLDFDLDKEDERHQKILNYLGDHLIAHYLWENIDYNTESALDKYFEISSKDNQSHVIFNIGRSLQNSKDLPVKTIERVKAFWNWREENKNVSEFISFVSWLKCECFTLEWRLTKLKNVLSNVPLNDMRVFSITAFLNETVNDFLTMTLECLVLLTDTGEYIYYDDEEIKAILLLGDSSKNNEDRQLSIEARDNLLKAGHYNFKD